MYCSPALDNKSYPLTPFLSAAKRGDVDELTRNWVHRDKEKALAIATAWGHLSIVRFLIEECGVPRNRLQMARSIPIKTLDYLQNEPKHALTKQKIYELFLVPEEESQLQKRVFQQLKAEYSYKQFLPLVKAYEMSDTKQLSPFLGQTHPLLMIQFSDDEGTVQPTLLQKVDLFVRTTIKNYVVTQEYYQIAENFVNQEEWPALFDLLRGKREIPFQAQTEMQLQNLQLKMRIKLHLMVCHRAMDLNNKKLLLQVYQEMPMSSKKKEFTPFFRGWLDEYQRKHESIKNQSNDPPPLPQEDSEDTLCAGTCVIL